MEVVSKSCRITHVKRQTRREHKFVCPHEIIKLLVTKGAKKEMASSEIGFNRYRTSFVLDGSRRYIMTTLSVLHKLTRFEGRADGQGTFHR